MPHYSDEELDRATVLYTTLGKPQKDIATILGWTPSKVSRVLKIAAEDGRWHEDRSYTLSPDLESRLPTIISELEQLAGKKYELLNAWLKDIAPRNFFRGVHVFHSDRQPRELGETIESLSVWDRAAMQFAKGAAGAIQVRLANARLCGLAWGRTLRAVLWKIAETQFPSPWSGHPIKFFPLWGDVPGQKEDPSTVFVSDSELSSTRLAEDFHELANKCHIGDYVVPNLRGSLAIMPVREFAADPHTRDTVVRLIERNPEYQRVFQELVPSMDTALVSVGSFDQPGRAFSGSVLQYAGVTLEEMREFFLGDIGGKLIEKPAEQSRKTKKERAPKPGAAKKAREITAAEIQSAWLGVTADQLKSCAKNAAEDRTKGGVLVCAAGFERCPTVLAAIRAGYCTEIFIDDDLANALEQERRNIGQ